MEKVGELAAPKREYAIGYVVRRAFVGILLG